MSAYRVVIPMLSPAAFPATVKHTQVGTFYIDDVVTGADPRDIERLLAHGWIEPVEPVTAEG